MTRGRTLALVGTGLVVGKVVVSRKGHGRAILGLLLAPLVPLLLAPLNLWDDFIGGVHDIEDKIKNLVAKAIDIAIGWIKAFVDDAKSGFDNLFQWVGEISAAVGQLTAQVAQGIVHGIGSAVSSVAGWVAQAISDVRNWVGGLFNTLHDWIARGLHDLSDLIDSVWAAVQRDVWNPLKSLIDGVWDWIQQHLLPMIRGWVDDVKGWASDAVKWVAGLVGSISDWVERIAKPLLGLLGKAEHFLLFVVEHPLDWWLVALRDIVGAAPKDLIGLLTHGAEAGIGSVEELAAKWIG